MPKHRNQLLSILAVVLILGTICPVSLSTMGVPIDDTAERYSPSDLPSDQVPLRRVAIVTPDTNSYVDEFAYMATVPTSVFYHNDTQYISPLIYGGGFQSENWLLEDWTEYITADGGITQAFAVGDLTESYVSSLQHLLGAKVYPRISGTSAADIAAKIATSEWGSSSTAVIAVIDEDFNTPSVITGSSSHTFENQASELFEFSGIANFSAPSTMNFTPPSWAGWIEGAFNWTTNDLITHQLYDPNGEVVDYSIYIQVYFSRNPVYVEAPVPLNFWMPKTVDGEWSMELTRDSSLPAVHTNMEADVFYHPGHIVTANVPDGARWFNTTLTWDNVATDLNLALVDPTGRMVMWAPAGSILSSPGSETIELPYPMAGDWKIISAWMDATTEQNNIELSWEISQQPTDLSDYMEGAANAASLASLLNSPLLYVDTDAVPAETQWALSRLGVTDIWLVDPSNHQGASLEGLLNTSMTLNNMRTYSSVSSAITGLSQSPDIVLTMPICSGNEVFAPAAFSAAAHGAPVFSLTGDDNLITTRAQETWAPYMIGPEINNIYVINKFENRAENGWYDERIPNKFSMMESVDTFESFLIDRDAYNATTPQPVVVIAPESLLPLSFDRSLQTHFMPGRIPATTAAMSSVLINRGLLHRFLFLTSENADTALVSMYAYTDGADFSDNNYDYYKLYQIENTTDALDDAGFTNELHVGQNEVFEMVASQVGLWSFSTHGTLTLLPRDPPSRPFGPGHFSLRNVDALWGFEETETIRESSLDGDRLVNPVVYAAENANHVTRSTDDLEAAIGNIGSPIVILTACLLGGTGMPLMLMEHGAVGVTAAPRTVYFQPAGMLSVLLAQSLCDGETLGYALTSGLDLISADYSDPLPDRDPRDYANQQILFGDPSVRLYEPSSSPRVMSEDPVSNSFGSHIPGRGATGVAALGVSSYLPDALDSLGLSYDYYETSNYSTFTQLLSIRKVVLIEPNSIPALGASLTTSTSEILNFVRNGGVLVVLGVSDNLDWLPWDVSVTSTGNGSSITVTDAQHPLLSIPNTLSSSVDYQGYFSSVSANFSIVATEGTEPVILAGAIGSGKVALTTTNPTGPVRDSTIENAVEWYDAPSILLSSYSLSQQIIWAGDTVRIDLQFEDLVGTDITDADITVWLNSSQIDAENLGSGVFRVSLTGAWTGSNVGTFDLRIHATKPGYDTLSLRLEQFILIRPFPWLTIGVLGGGVVALIIGWIYVKKKRGDNMPWTRDKKPRDEKMSKKERKRREKEDGKADVKEYFGV